MTAEGGVDQGAGLVGPAEVEQSLGAPGQGLGEIRGAAEGLGEGGLGLDGGVGHEMDHAHRLPGAMVGRVDPGRAAEQIEPARRIALGQHQRGEDLQGLGMVGVAGQASLEGPSGRAEPAGRQVDSRGGEGRRAVNWGIPGRPPPNEHDDQRDDRGGQDQGQEWAAEGTIRQAQSGPPLRPRADGRRPVESLGALSSCGRGLGRLADGPARRRRGGASVRVGGDDLAAGARAEGPDEVAVDGRLEEADRPVAEGDVAPA